MGVCALALILLALAAPKRRGLHPWAGRLALGTLAIAVVVSIPAIVAKTNVFLVGMGLLVVSHGVVAWWAAARKPRAAVGLAARVLLGGVAAAFVAFGALGVRVLLRGNGMGAVVIGMAAVGLVLMLVVWRFDHRRTWLALHIHGVAGSVIAGITAFGAAAGPRLLPDVPAWTLWLLPTLILTPTFVLLGRRQRRRAAPRRPTEPPST